MKIACIILTNKKTEDIYQKNYAMLCDMSVKSKYNVDLYTYYNDESIYYESNDSMIHFSYKSLQDKFNYYHLFDEANTYVGNTILALFDLYTNHKDEYDSYIFYEDDVAYTSDDNLFDTIFDNFKPDSYDIIFQSPRRKEDDWVWLGNSNCTFPPYYGLLNLYIIKPKLIEELIHFIKDGNYGHHEYIINGFVLSNGLKVRYLSDFLSVYSSYCKIGNLYKTYDILHPIKNCNELDFLISTQHQPKFCIMTMIKNERLYLKEWIDYHLKLGFDAIFIFEDYRSESHEDIVKDYDNVYLDKIEKTGIHDYKSNETTTQIKLFKYFLYKLKNEKIYDWCLYIDVDEFLVMDDGITLEKLCLDYQEYTGLILSWKMFNANKHIKRPIGNVMDNYTKSINVIIDGDNNFTRYNKKSFVNVHKAKTFFTNHCIEDGVDIEMSHNVDNKIIHHTAWINHYFTKSFEDYCYRMQIRGNMGNNNRTYDQFFEVNPELYGKKRELIFSQRYNRNNNVHYISKEYKLISGGNIEDINNLNKK